MDTIFALSSGRPPAAVAVIRISGPQARQALLALMRTLPEPRRAVLRTLRDRDGAALDRALTLWFPGPGSATGEDMAELHVHGGRAVIDAVEAALYVIDGLRRAEPGEFTRRSFANGRIDLAQAEGLADLLEAETELQRRNAMALSGGALSRMIDRWRERLLGLSAQVESGLDFSDEGDVSDNAPQMGNDIALLYGAIADWLAQPRAERLREGYKVVVAGPPNAGKSTLFNALVEDEAAIAAPVAGTTRDLIERAVSLEGIPFTFIDTAGLRDKGDDPVEAIGIERALAAAQNADCVLWLGPEGEGPAGAWEIAAKSDLPRTSIKSRAARQVSAKTGAGLDNLRADLIAQARTAMPGPGQVALNQRQHHALRDALDALDAARHTQDWLILGEHLRAARAGLDRLAGRTATEDMLDALFGRFCIGK